PPSPAPARAGARAGARPRTRPRTRAGARAAAARPQRQSRVAAALPLGAARARELLAAVWRRRRLRAALMLAVVLGALGGGAWLWLRHSSLAAVRQVRISGVHGPDASAIDAALGAAARRMSTLDVNG